MGHTVTTMILLGILLISCTEKKEKAQKKDIIEIREIVHVTHIRGIVMDYFLEKNKPYYRLNLGDTLKIYYSTNSCCPFCIPEMKNLHGLRYLGSKAVVPNPEGCAGCNVVTELSFEANLPGQVVFKMGKTSPLDDCGNDNIHDPEIVKIDIVQS